jgi:hypothetical protein
VAISSVLGRKDVLALPESQQHIVIRDLLSGPLRILLVIDNLETLDDERVTAFLRELPQPCKAIVTSRHRIDVAYSIRLQGLPTDEARALISQESARRNVHLDEPQVAELIRKTAGIPLAIQWSIGLMAMGHAIESVLARLGSGHSDIAHFCFAESVTSIRGARGEDSVYRGNVRRPDR